MSRDPRIRDDPTNLPDDYDSFSLTGNNQNHNAPPPPPAAAAAAITSTFTSPATSPSTSTSTSNHVTPATTSSSTSTSISTSTSTSSSAPLSVYDEEPPQCSLWFEPKDWSRRYAATFFTCSIVSHRLSPEDPSVALYDIQVRCAHDTWIISHRFSEFEQLLQAVKQEIPRSDQTALSGTSLTASARVTRPAHDDEKKSGPSSPSSANSTPWPVLPAKTWSAHGDTRAEFLNERQEKLQTFLMDLLRLRPKMGLLPSIRQFLDLDHPLTPSDED